MVSSISLKNDNEIFSVFSIKQIDRIKKLSLPSILVFKTATKFDTKRIETKSDIWKYTFSGSDNIFSFKGDSEEIKFKKYILASFVNKNSPMGLDQLNVVLTNLLLFSKEAGGLSYKNSVKFLEESKNVTYFYYCIYALRILCTKDFPEFSYNKIGDLEFIPRPINDSWLTYQDIDNVLSIHDKNMVSRGIKEISLKINDKTSPVSDKELVDCAILGLCYTCGVRPVQLARLAIRDLRVDSHNKKNGSKRYSILMPYAKKNLEVGKILIAIPSELAEILVEYQISFDKKQGDQFFDMGSNAALFVNKSINSQMLRFASEHTRKAINDNTMIQPHYSSYDFRHNVGHSLAMNGASADEIAHIMGHSSLTTAKHYILATPELALVRAKALGTNPVWQTMICMMLTGSIVQKDKWNGKEVFGIIDGKIHSGIGGCSRSYKECPFSEVRACYGCLYYHPFVEGEHNLVLSSIRNELLDLIEISDSTGCSHNPLIQVHESTKLEVESVIARCRIHDNDEQSNFIS